MLKREKQHSLFHSLFKKRKPFNYQLVKRFCSTRGGNRTRTTLLSLDFESSASTNSATRAGKLLFTARHKDNPKFFFPKCFYQKVLTVVYSLIRCHLCTKPVFFNIFLHFFGEFLRGILHISCQGFILYLLILPNVDR